MELLRDIIARYLDATGLSRQLQQAELLRVWREMLGDLADHTRLDAVRGDVVTFAVDNAALMAELANFRKEELLAGLRAGVKGLNVRQIKFRPGSSKPRR